MGKSTTSGAIFHSYVKSPEGTPDDPFENDHSSFRDDDDNGMMSQPVIDVEENTNG